MPRRRMIDPDFWKDHCIAALTRDERLFLIGSISNSDDEGRLEGHAAYLKAAIFMYDDELTPSEIAQIKDSCLNKMATWPKNHQYKIVSYQNSSEDYLFFPNWLDQQKPSHPTKSKLPPPLETLPIFSSEPHDAIPKQSEPPPEPFAPSLGQSSLGKVSIGKVSAVQEDFTKFSDSNKDLTDFLTTTLEKYMPRGSIWLCTVLKEFWKQCAGQEMPNTVFQMTANAVKQHPPNVLAVAYVKAVKYTPGKTSPANYLKKILEDKAVDKPP